MERPASALPHDRLDHLGERTDGDEPGDGLVLEQRLSANVGRDPGEEERGRSEHRAPDGGGAQADRKRACRRAAQHRSLRRTSVQPQGTARVPGWAKIPAPRMGVLVFSARHVLAALDPADAVEAVRTAFLEHARGAWFMPPKVYVPVPDGDFRAMPAAGGGHAVLKWVTSFPENPRARPADRGRGRPPLRRRARAGCSPSSTPARSRRSAPAPPPCSRPRRWVGRRPRPAAVSAAA